MGLRRSRSAVRGLWVTCLVSGGLILAPGQGAEGRTAPAATAQPGLTARSALVMDEGGKILFQRNAWQLLPPASTTKVLTVLLTLERVPLTDVVKVSPRAASMEPSRLGLKVGETYSVAELCCAALMKSANDACVALAEHVAGSEKQFAVLMTRRAHELGATRSQFRNASGLPASGHVTTAHDLALILNSALENPVFQRIATMPSVHLEWEGHHAPHDVLNKNKMLVASTPVLGKTGYTIAARHCYVGKATGERPVTVVLLGARKLWPEVRRLVALGLGKAPTRIVSGEPPDDVPDSALTY